MADEGFFESPSGDLRRGPGRYGRVRYERLYPHPAQGLDAEAARLRVEANPEVMPPHPEPTVPRSWKRREILGMRPLPLALIVGAGVLLPLTMARRARVLAIGRPMGWFAMPRRSGWRVNVGWRGMWLPEFFSRVFGRLFGTRRGLEWSRRYRRRRFMVAARARRRPFFGRFGAQPIARGRAARGLARRFGVRRASRVRSAWIVPPRALFPGFMLAASRPGGRFGRRERFIVMRRRPV